jgi:hypothetical protein
MDTTRLIGLLSKRKEVHERDNWSREQIERYQSNQL